MKKIFVPKELGQESRVALTPDNIKKISSQYAVLVEKSAGEQSGFSDDEYKKAGAEVIENRNEALKKADITFNITAPLVDDIQYAKENAIFIGAFVAQEQESLYKKALEKKITLFSLNQLPRITRAQKMDVLSSQSNFAGYKAVLLAANKLKKIFPLMMTAAGTVKPAKVVILGAGVAGLQAIATAKRLGAQVEVSDIRLAAKEQVESLGGKFIMVPGMEDLEDENGYAKPPTPEFLSRQAEIVSEKISQADVVISTALIPGRPAPKLIKKEMVEKMKAGSVIVDMAAIAGGNCELTETGKTVIKNDVVVVGETNLLSEVSTHASQLFGANMVSFLEELFNSEGKIRLEDEVIEKCKVVL